MPLALDKKLPLILLLVLLMLAAVGFLSYRSNDSLKQSIGWQKHTQEVLLKLDDMLISVLNIETGGRGYVLTGNESFLESYNAGKTTAVKDLEDLQTALGDNKQQLENLAALREQIDRKITKSQNYVEMRRTDGLLNAINEVSKGEGNSIMNGIRANIEKMKVEENRLLKVREDNLQNTLNNNFWLMFVSSLAGVAGLAIANFIVLFEIKKRHTAENALVNANKDLEKRVAERTEELKLANENLRESESLKRSVIDSLSIEVAERKQNEIERERLLQNEKDARREAEIANRLRDEFMATVSHELRTPLNAILGWAKILKSGKADANKSVKAVDTIIKNAETQNRLIEDLMDVSRIISGKLVLENEKINVEELVSGSIETVKPSADDKSIALDFNAEESAKEKFINGDLHRLRQVFLNLLTNAIKFTPQKGEIKVALTVENEFAVVKIKDSGIGINAEFLPYVFERFRQDAANIRQSGGLGLGLAIVRQLTELHGGEVSVESEGENKGATFTVKFPISF